MNIGECMEYAQKLCDAKSFSERIEARKELRAAIAATVKAETDHLTRELAEAKARAVPSWTETKFALDAWLKQKGIFDDDSKAVFAAAAWKACWDFVMLSAAPSLRLTDCRVRSLTNRNRRFPMSDYTLPCLPGPAIAKKYGPQVEAYGHACAEAARAPLAEENARLLARIAELEADVSHKDEYATQIGRSLAKTDAECKSLRAEVEALRADAERWQFWKPRLICADFEYVLDHQGFSVLVFEIPDGVQVSADLDKTTDTAIAARKGEGSE